MKVQVDSSLEPPMEYKKSPDRTIIVHRLWQYSKDGVCDQANTLVVYWKSYFLIQNLTGYLRLTKLTCIITCKLKICCVAQERHLWPQSFSWQFCTTFGLLLLNQIYIT